VPTNPIAKAILRVGTSDKELPTTSPDFTFPPTGISGKQTVCPLELFSTCTLDAPTNLQPVPPLNAPRNADVTILLNIALGDNPAENNDTVFLFNNSAFIPPMTTTILDLVRANETDKIPASANMFEIPYGSVVDIIVNSGVPAAPHPLHLHGHEFFILGYGIANTGNYNSTEDEASLDYVNPLRRDTASVSANSWIYLRYIANNPGVWLFHCHINFHSSRGLSIGFIEGKDEIVEIFGKTKTLKTCPFIYGSPAGAK